MNAVVHSKTFKSGDGVAVLLPDSFGLAAGAEVQLSRNGTTIEVRAVKPKSEDPATAKARLTAMMDRLREIGPVGEIEKHEPIEFPDRPGLY